MSKEPSGCKFTASSYAWRSFWLMFRYVLFSSYGDSMAIWLLNALVAASSETALIFDLLKKIAEDYEKNHPGWKVIGGINADQYCWGYGSEATSGYDLLENRPYYTNCYLN
mgnify:CR=1 FL=1